MENNHFYLYDPRFSFHLFSLCIFLPSQFQIPLETRWFVLMYRVFFSSRCGNNIIIIFISLRLVNRLALISSQHQQHLVEVPSNRMWKMFGMMAVGQAGQRRIGWSTICQPHRTNKTETRTERHTHADTQHFMMFNLLI